MKHKLPYMRHMWHWDSKKGRFTCLRRKCKAVKSPETSEECRLWEQGKK